MIGKELVLQAALKLVGVATKRKSPKQALKCTVETIVKKQVGGRIRSRKSHPKKTMVVKRKTRRVPENELHREVAPVSLQGFKNIFKIIPSEAPHRSLNLFEKLPLLVTFEIAFTQKVGPFYSLDSPMLEFEVLGDGNDFIDLQRTRLEIVARTVRTVLRWNRASNTCYRCDKQMLAVFC